ncbi:hypothetical protein GCM10029963_16510 [Micromonospora andamanensis]|uniref:acetyl-CoA carboxylase biotin carboxyl carrier protein n=1 Tax=Micromonospora andamanensis TaxID=1287068 RepID=UPI001A62FBE9|nr:acetyl-CoA carboxylase biotin carboxyl carrier protein [Micromonospora andamanensis]GIJ39577.1 hypothetical protein Vwe01_29020 [Micromonospora andamanensis]
MSATAGAAPAVAGAPASPVDGTPTATAGPPSDAVRSRRSDADGAYLARTAAPTPDGDETGHLVDGVAGPGRYVAADAALTELRRHARQLVAELAEPVRRLRLRLGDAELEVEWDRPVGPDQGAPSGRPDSATAPAPRSPAGPSVALSAAAPATRISVRSPMVGTFYRAPQPGEAPFVAVGDLVRPGQVVGIVEAMKLMNEIAADRPGRVVEVLVADGQPVEYDQPLVVLDPA